MRIIFMGTPEFAVPSLRLLVENRLPVAAAVTTPDKPAGRGQQVTPSAVKCFALENHLELLQPESLGDPAFISRLQSLRPDLFVVVAFRILPPAVYSIPRLGAFNLHASLLPKYRGAAPINWAIINGEHETGVTTFFLEEKVDTGNVILQARVTIGEDETAGDLHDRLAEVGAELVLLTVRLIADGKAVPQRQTGAASQAPKIFRDHCIISWSKSAREVHNQIRGLSPRPCAFTFHRSTQLKMYRTHCLPDYPSDIPGTVLESGSRLVVACGSGALDVLELQQAGKKKMGTEEFLRGYGISTGHTFRESS